MDSSETNTLRRAKLIILMETLGNKILTYILKHDTDSPRAPPGCCLDEYLKNLPNTSKSSYIKLTERSKKNVFNASELRQIKKYPLWENFDITLLCKAIKLACENVAMADDAKWKNKDEMEGLIREIKEERNNLIHEIKCMTETDYLRKFEEFQNLFMKTLEAVKNKYNITDMEFKPIEDNVMKDINKIKQMEKIISKDYWSAMIPEFIHVIQLYLKNQYKEKQYFSPLSFLSKSNQVHIRSIFCNVTLAKQKHNIHETPLCIDSSDILTLTQVTKSMPVKKPQIFIINGIAGSGKTTLLTYIISEWLQDPLNCRIKHLQEYDILLHIVCREQDGPKLKDFLKLTLQNYVAVMEDYLEILLTECKVLFLIDGLDELSQGSNTDKLVQDIINVGKNVKNFTIICTSRPETVQDFWNTLPETYQRCKMEMQGIPRERRTECVLKHYDTFPNTTKENRDQLKNLIESVIWKDHFELPLNLLFVATLFNTNSDYIKNNTTQTKLYLTIHNWCLQKLQGRLANNTNIETDRQLREESIEKVLEVIYDISLQGILEDRLSLSESETKELRNICTAMKLPPRDIMGSFLCLRETTVHGLVTQEKYFAPHKSIQEVYAAKKIVDALEKKYCHGRNNLVLAKNACVTMFQSMFHVQNVSYVRTLLNKPTDTQLKRLRNLLLHVVGLLSQAEAPSIPTAIKEVVDLLANTGITDCNAWLSLLENTETNRTTLENIASYINSDPLEWVIVGDSNLSSAISLLPMIPRKKVRVVLHRTDADIDEIVSADHTYIELFLQHHYRQPQSTPVSDSLLRVMPRSHLEWFMGHLTSHCIKQLVDWRNLQRLYLAVKDQQDLCSMLPAIHQVCKALLNLQKLSLHVPVRDVFPSTCITSLPDVRHVILVLSGVDGTLLGRVSQLASALQPRKNGVYWAISFPESKMKFCMMQQIIDKFGQARVRAKWCIGVSITCPFTKEDEEQLSWMASTRLLGGVDRQPEHVLWWL